MAHAWQVVVEVDVPEPRVELGRLVALADGTTFLTERSTNIYTDPITRTSMLMPLPLSAAWLTTFTGNYARLTKADYTGLTSASWIEVPRRGSGDYYLQSAGPINEAATTTTTWGINQPMYLSVYVAGIQDLTNQAILECGWGTPGDAGSVWLRFRADGAVTIYKGEDSVPVGRYDWKTGGTLALAGSNASGKSTREQTIDIVLMPCRWQSLLCIVGGGGFEHVFEDLDDWTDGGTQPTITPAEPFFWRVPTDAGAACVQCAPVRFATTGSLVSPPIAFQYPPPTGSAFTHAVFGDQIGSVSTGLAYTGSLVDSGGVPITWDDVEDTAYLNLNLTGNGTNTYGIYTHSAVLVPTQVFTADEPVDITCLVDVEFTARLNRPCEVKLTSKRRASELDDAGVEQAQVTSDRAFRIAIGSVDLVRGTLSSPRLEINEADNDTDSNASHVVWDGLDRLAELNYNEYDNALPVDNYTLRDSIAQLFTDTAMDSSMYSLDDDGFRLPFSPRCSQGEYLNVQQYGDTRGKWLQEMHQSYAQTWEYYFAPGLSGYKFLWRDPDSMSTTPVMDLFEGRGLATTFGITGAVADWRTITEVKLDRIPPAANRAVVRGYDPRRNTLVKSVWNNAGSQDPTTAAASRPEDWRGRVHTSTFNSPRVNSQAVADRIKDMIAARVGVVTQIIYWRSDLLIRSSDDRPLWLGDVVRIYRAVSGSATGTARGDYRITEINGRLLMNREDERPIWQASYTAEKVPA